MFASDGIETQGAPEGLVDSEGGFTAAVLYNSGFTCE